MPVETRSMHMNALTILGDLPYSDKTSLTSNRKASCLSRRDLFTNLPPEILHNIIYYIKYVPDIINLMNTCILFSQVISSDNLLWFKNGKDEGIYEPQGYISTFDYYIDVTKRAGLGLVAWRFWSLCLHQIPKNKKFQIRKVWACRECTLNNIIPKEQLRNIKGLDLKEISAKLDHYRIGLHSGRYSIYEWQRQHKIPRYFCRKPNIERRLAVLQAGKTLENVLQGVSARNRKYDLKLMKFYKERRDEVDPHITNMVKSRHNGRSWKGAVQRWKQVQHRVYNYRHVTEGDLTQMMTDYMDGLFWSKVSYTRQFGQKIEPICEAQIKSWVNCLVRKSNCPIFSRFQC